VRPSRVELANFEDMVHEPRQQLEVPPEHIELFRRRVDRERILHVHAARTGEGDLRVVVVMGCIDPGRGVHRTVAGRAAIDESCTSRRQRRARRRSICQLLDRVGG
jgi:hypothetical protein